DLGSAAGGGCCYTERVVGGSASASFPFSQVERSHALGLAYELFSLSQHTNPQDRPIATGTLAAGTLAWSYSDARRYVNSISSEEGQRFSVALRVSDPALGSTFSFWQLSTALSRYFRVPFTMH